MTIHYRWHALYGRTVRRFYSEKRTGIDVVLVEGEPGAAIVVAAWMLDPSVCASMTIGAPQVSLPALSELHQLLMERGLRRSFSADDRVVKGGAGGGAFGRQILWTTYGISVVKTARRTGSYKLLACFQAQRCFRRWFSMASKSIRVIVVADVRLYREGLAAVLGSAAPLVVVGQAGD